MDFATMGTMKTSSEVLALSDSDEEIFVGPITDKEKKKAAKLSRRTQVFFPPISWKLRSSNHTVRKPKESPASRLNSSPIWNEDSELKRVESLFGEKEPSTRGIGVELPSNGDTADISSAKIDNDTVPEADSLEYGYSADSLNSLSRDSLDIDHDSLEENKKVVCDCDDTSVVEDLYDVGECLKARQDEHEGSVPAAQKQFTFEEIEELQKQLHRFAMEIGEKGNYVQESSEKHNNSFEAEDVDTENENPVIEPDFDSVFTGNQGLPSPYDLNKQRLSNIFSIERKSYPMNVTVTKDRLGTVREVSNTGIESRVSGVRLSEEFPDTRCDSPRKGSTDYLPNSTQLFEELERQIEEEDSVHSNQQITYTAPLTVLSESHLDSSSDARDAEYIADATYTLLSNPTVEHPESNRNTDQASHDLSYQHSGHNVSVDSCPEGVFNDTLEEIEMLLEYGMDYSNDKHDKCEEPIAQETEDYRPKSADSCGSHQFGRSTPGTREKVVKARTPKRTPLTPTKTQPKVYRTPVKTPTSSKPYGGAQSSSASNPTRVPRCTVTPRSAPMRSTKLDPPFKKSVHPVEKTGNETPKFKVPAKIPISASRMLRTQSAAGTVTYSPRPNKLLNQIQSPIGAYIHNLPSPILMTNVKPKTCTSITPKDRGHEKRPTDRPVWENIDSRNHKVDGSENINPNVGHGLRAVHYIQAPCIKLDDHSVPKTRLPRLGDRFEKLLDSPCPQVIKHEGRVRVNPSSPQYTAAVKAVRSNLNDSIRSEAAAALDDSDEEIFVGPVTAKEKEKASKLNRKTQVLEKEEYRHLKIK